MRTLGLGLGWWLDRVIILPPTLTLTRIRMATMTPIIIRTLTVTQDMAFTAVTGAATAAGIAADITGAVDTTGVAEDMHAAIAAAREVIVVAAHGVTVVAVRGVVVVVAPVDGAGKQSAKVVD